MCPISGGLISLAGPITALTTVMRVKTSINTTVCQMVPPEIPFLSANHRGLFVVLGHRIKRQTKKPWDASQT